MICQSGVESTFDVWPECLCPCCQVRWHMYEWRMHSSNWDDAQDNNLTAMTWWRNASGTTCCKKTEELPKETQQQPNNQAWFAVDHAWLLGWLVRRKATAYWKGKVDLARNYSNRPTFSPMKYQSFLDDKISRIRAETYSSGNPEYMDTSHWFPGFEIVTIEKVTSVIMSCSNKQCVLTLFLMVNQRQSYHHCSF